MKTINKTLIIITGTSIAFLVAILLQILFAGGTVELYAFNWVQWLLELCYLVLCITIGLRVSISILLDDEELSLEPVKSVTAELEQAIEYITLLEKHIRYNDNAEVDVMYVPYNSTELEIQIEEFKNKHYDNRR
jgi:hypothetical protein